MEQNDRETVGQRPVIITEVNLKDLCNCQCNCNGKCKWLLARTDGNSHKGRETVGLLINIRAVRRRYNNNGKDSGTVLIGKPKEAGFSLNVQCFMSTF